MTKMESVSPLERSDFGKSGVELKSNRSLTIDNFMSPTFRFLKKGAATLLLFVGIPLSAVCLAMMMSPNQTADEREDALITFFIVALPPTALGGWLAWGLRQEHQRKLTAQSAAENDRLQSVFFRVLEENRGETTILRLAKEAKISGEEARAYLDRKAVEFDATFEVGEQGEITYQFHL